MKLKNLTNLMALGLALTFASAGCKKGPEYLTRLPNGTTPNGGETPLPPGQQTGNPTDLNANPNGIPLGSTHDGWTPNAEILKDQTIYFDYDKSAVKASEHTKLAAVADYMKGHPDIAVRVEGNCDERGTEEYNRSLGERRALAGREYLVTLGIEPSRIDTVTYGEDRPVETGHNEAAWSKNRRDDFVVLTKP